MAVTYEQLMSLEATNEPITYTDRETILYALSVGMGRDPLNASELPYVYEGNGLKTVPSLATVLMRIPILVAGLDMVKLLHGEQRLTMHHPIPPEGDLLCDSRVSGVYDKGPGKGAIVLMEANVRTAAEGKALFTATTVFFARGDGGAGGPGGAAPRPHAVPDRAPDSTCAVETRPDQALLYRLNIDRNPLHADPAVAKRAGFNAPILHGLCAYGNVCRALLKSVCDYDHRRIAGLDVRFSAPIYPGETIDVDIWRDGNVVSFRCRVSDRNLVVMDNGKCTLTS
jgi:acyl dehydratase